MTWSWNWSRLGIRVLPVSTGDLTVQRHVYLLHSNLTDPLESLERERTGGHTVRMLSHGIHVVVLSDGGGGAV